MSVEITWRQALETGMPAIDDQHKELFRRFNALLKACNEGCGRDEVGRLLDFLNDYVLVHFFDEEELQKEHNYPEYAAHRQEHLVFTGRLDALRKDYAEEGASLVLVIQANNMLIDWLTSHIAKSDRKIGEFLRRECP